MWSQIITEDRYDLSNYILFDPFHGGLGQIWRDVGVSYFVVSLIKKTRSLSYRVMNWLTEIIELNNKHLVLKIEHIDWITLERRKFYYSIWIA